jgi:hypothetical protein
MNGVRSKPRGPVHAASNARVRPVARGIEHGRRGGCSYPEGTAGHALPLMIPLGMEAKSRIEQNQAICDRMPRGVWPVQRRHAWVKALTS